MMSKRFARLFSEQDRTAIAAAITQAEGRTAGEIVPYVVTQSDDYEIATWRGGMFALLVLLTALLLVRWYSSHWLELGFLATAMLVLAAQGTGMLAVHFLPPLKRFFAGARLIEQRVGQRAAVAFLDEEIFRTRERTGILIFLSLLEHKVIVLGDAGINAKVQQAEWDEVVRLLTEGMRAGAPAQALIRAIKKCGELLERQGVSPRPDDTSELSDKLRFTDR
ncbi:MAG: hypothetical protein ONB48_06825 [candidate division KSB1 bacterium]|nr:hypothetical protein [candidate division KSB1 bacterium]MDZ7273255.1 hypothetical protein [candidate division KSB1 bacterium]MDZ7285357.1 hypothetical protein [candidate division KSB1 bacterium]MDZ7298389.1 hypothetical protein [candidate division KSB1 bacterium]MDZ7306467.1 hypothetical protein [candidate division KSB1 bacterium]